VGGTRLAFLSCHLAAHAGEANAALRASQLRAALDAGARACAPSSASSAEGTRLEDMHHHTFVFGDLNFRIDGDAFLSASRADAAAAPSDAASNAPLLPPPADAPPAALSLRSVTAAALGGTAPAGDAWRAVAAAVAARRWEELRRADELRGELREGRALEGYQEGPLTFPPTFKLVRGSGSSGSGNYAPPPPLLAQGKSGGVATAPAPPPRAYASKRIPSWTDRCVRDVARVDCSAAQGRRGPKAHLMRMIAC
jgi:hypothetical protein